MAIKKEEELYAPVKEYFMRLGYEVKAEVKHCDLVAIHPDTGHTIIVEMKRTFNLALLLQGVERLRLGGQVILVAERNRKKSGAHNQRYGDIAELCRRLGVGFMTVTFYKTKAPLVEIWCEPGDTPMRQQQTRKSKRLLQEFHERSGDYNVGGSHARKLITAYREKALRIAFSLHMLELASPKDIITYTNIANSGSILRSNYYGWYERVERGKYKLHPAGQKALVEYEEIVEQWTPASQLIEQKISFEQ